ncbi:MAG: hypothetical protein NC517_09185 [Firmicutes bacterium]|nr:hypothetical protein [Bacillota bacterium]
MSGILIRKAVGMMEDDPKSFTKSVIPAIMLSLVGVALALSVLSLSISPKTLEKLLEGVGTPYAVIEAYYKWYGLMGTTTVACMVIVAVFGVAAIVTGRKSAVGVLCAVCISGAGFLISGVMYLGEDISALRTKAEEDMAQIAEGRAESAVVSFDKDVERSGLPGPYADGQPTMFAVYSGIGEDTDNLWRGFFILDDLGFAPDEDRMYDENRSIEWNDENAGWYAVTYTTNFHVVLSVEPLRAASTAGSEAREQQAVSGTTAKAFLSDMDIHPLYAAFLRNEISVADPYVEEGAFSELAFLDDADTEGDGYSWRYFSLLDVNSDGDPELIVEIRDLPSQVVYILGVQDNELICYDVFETHTSHLAFYVCGNGIVWWGQDYDGVESVYYTFDADGKVHELIHFVREADSDSELSYDYYYLDGKREVPISLQSEEEIVDLDSRYWTEEQPEWFKCEDFADIPQEQ